MRLFVSIRPSADVVAHLSAALAGRATSRADQWHVTLAFLGEVASAEPLYDGLRAAAAGHAPFDLHLQGGGTFGRTTWAGVVGDVDALRSLHADVIAACSAAGVALADRRYRPHLTVGRLQPSALRDYEGPPWTVVEVELVRSVLGKGAVHSVLERFPLWQPPDQRRTPREITAHGCG